VAHDVFISYATKDKPAADAVCAKLEARGVRCWIAPRDIMYGADWGEAIVEAIHASRAMVLVFSSHANESVQIKREVDRAVSRGIPVIPLRIENVTPERALEYYISTVHWLDALTPPLEAHLETLAEKVHTLLSKPGPDRVDAGEIAPQPVRVGTPKPPARRPLWVAGSVAGVLLAAGIAGVAWWSWPGRPGTPGSPGTQDSPGSVGGSPGTPPQSGSVQAPPTPASNRPEAATSQVPSTPEVTPPVPGSKPMPAPAQSVEPPASAVPIPSPRAAPTAQQVREQILASLRAIGLERVSVDVDADLNARLKGTVPDDRSVSAALQLSRASGARAVSHELVVDRPAVAARPESPPQPGPARAPQPPVSSQPSGDSEQVRGQVLTALKAHRIESLAVDVDPQLTVYLRGTLPDVQTLRTALRAPREVRRVRGVTYNILVKGSQATGRRTSDDPPDVLQAKILHSLNQSGGVADIRVEVDPALKVHLSGSVRDYRGLNTALAAVAYQRPTSLTYEVAVVGSDR